jgi:Na+-transporting methylmalonyl-CoA/oxaloacetate decarboxylase gamma subunit
MSVAQNLGQGLLLTVVGMALVFVTLIIVMVAIWVLDRLFRPTPLAAPATAIGGRGTIAATGAKVSGSAPAAKAVTSDKVAPGSGASGSGEAAAIAVAILVERGRRKVSTQAVDLPCSVVNVVRIDPGHGTWRGDGRLRAME